MSSFRGVKLKPYIIVYDLTIRSAEFGQFYAALMRFQDAQRFTHASWLVRSAQPAEEIATYLKQFGNPDDRVTVIEIAGKWSAHSGQDDSGVGWLWNFASF